MTGSKESLQILIGQKKVADLSQDNERLKLSYTKSWCESGYAISPHLPLRENHSSQNISRFLRNLLPEGNCLEEILSNYSLSRSNTYALVRVIGLDLSGALVLNTWV